MSLPRGRCVHCLPERLRIRVDSMRRDDAFFHRVKEALQQEFPQAEISVNTMTGSLLLRHTDYDLPSLAKTAADRGLFELAESDGQVPVARSIQRSFEGANRAVRRATGSELDLPSLVFIFLAGTAAYQIGRGNISLPPWYTAFWYAFGVFTKSLIDAGDSAPQSIEAR